MFRSEAAFLENGSDPVVGPGTQVYIQVGDNDRAIASLEEIAAGRNRAAVVFLGPWLDPLRPDPRFQALMKNLGIDPFWSASGASYEKHSLRQACTDARILAELIFRHYRADPSFF